MCNCKDCKGITLLSGNDGVGIVSITYNEVNNTIIVLYTDGTSYTSPSIGCECPSNVFYSERTLGEGSTGTLASPVVIDGTTYTVPTGGAGKYRILYTAQAAAYDVPGGTADIIVKLRINSTYHPIFRTTRVSINEAIEGIALNYQVDLVPGDVIRLEGSATEPEVQWLEMGVIIIDKIG